MDGGAQEQGSAHMAGQRAKYPVQAEPLRANLLFERLHQRVSNGHQQLVDQLLIAARVVAADAGHHLGDADGEVELHGGVWPRRHPARCGVEANDRWSTQNADLPKLAGSILRNLFVVVWRR